MKASLLVLALVPCLLLQAVAQESLKEVQTAFAEKQDQISGAYRAGVDKLGIQFLSALGKAREAAIKAGSLDAVQAIDAEAARWKLEEDLPATESSVAEIAKLHETLREAKADLLVKRQRGVVAWHQDYDKRLQGIEKSLVTAGKVEEAQGVRTERDALRDSLTLKEATEAVKAADDEAAKAAKAPKAAAAAKGPWKKLKSLKPASFKGGEYFERLLTGRKKPVMVGGAEYQPDDFIYTHAPGRVEYEFGLAITSFRATLCLEDSSSQGNVTFKIETDAGEIYKSKVLKNGDKLDNVDLTFKPTRKLVIVVDNNGSDAEDWSLMLKPEYK